jgi:hypothetical protein
MAGQLLEMRSEIMAILYLIYVKLEVGIWRTIGGIQGLNNSSWLLDVKLLEIA